MTKYQIEVTLEAKTDLNYYSVFERKIITSGIRLQLEHEPTLGTRNRKQLRDNSISSWEVRVGKYRVFYEVNEAAQIVTVVAVAHKEHNVLLVRGKEVQI
jgi:mRNA-degrading endonuclease RelE of RelBE toxin-antitoxin system